MEEKVAANLLKESFRGESEKMPLVGFQCPKCGNSCLPDVVGVINFCPFCGEKILSSNIVSFSVNHRSTRQEFCPTCGNEVSLEELRRSLELLQKDFPYHTVGNPTIACPECLPEWMKEDIY